MARSSPRRSGRYILSAVLPSSIAAFLQAELAKVKLHQEIVARLAAKYHFPEVLFQKAFDDACQYTPAEHCSWDGMHPTYAGHGLMI